MDTEGEWWKGSDISMHDRGSPFINDDFMIRLQFRYDRSEYIRAMRSLIIRRIRWARNITTIILIASAACFFMVREGPTAWNMLLVVSVVMYVLVLSIAVIAGPVWRYRTSPQLRDEYTLIFSDDGISFTTHHIDSRLQWSVYTSWMETDDAFLLLIGTDQISVIPRSAFRTDQEQTEFRTLVQRHIHRQEGN